MKKCKYAKKSRTDHQQTSKTTSSSCNLTIRCDRDFSSITSKWCLPSRFYYIKWEDYRFASSQLHFFLYMYSVHSSLSRINPTRIYTRIHCGNVLIELIENISAYYWSLLLAKWQSLSNEIDSSIWVEKPHFPLCMYI